MLKNAGVVQSELELSSVHPPSMPSARVITAPSAAMSRTTTPAAIDIQADADDAPLPARRSRAAFFVGLGLVAAAAALFVLRDRLPQDAPVSAAPQRGSELAATPAAAPIAPQAAPRELDVDAELAARSSASAAPAARSATPPRAAKAKSVARPPRPAGPVPKRPRGDDDLDPGF
jgi:hypothetical protein